MDYCDYILKLLAISGMTWFWLWYLVWEYEYFLKGERRNRWWEYDLRKLFRRK